MSRSMDLHLARSSRSSQVFLEELQLARSFPLTLADRRSLAVDMQAAKLLLRLRGQARARFSSPSDSTQSAK